jgi:hypothetical protein
VSTQIIQHIAAVTTALQTKLDALKTECNQVFKDLYATRKRGWENIVNILMWWIDAKQDKHFDELTLGDEFRQGREVNHGHNFSPLLKHLYGAAISDQHRNKLSRALNALLKEYERNPEMYASNPEIKLVSYIQNKGGFVQLIKGTYSKAQLSAEGDFELAEEIAITAHEERAAEEAALTEAEMAGWNFKFKLLPRYTIKESRRVKDEVVTEKLLKEAINQMAPLVAGSAASFDDPMLTNPQGYAVALIKRESKGFTHYNTMIDKVLIESAIVNGYRKKFDACATSLRVLCEGLRTQLLPTTLKLKQKDLIQVVADPANPNEEKLARTRLLFKGASGEFVLSQLHVSSGVVTTFKPKTSFMDAPNFDVALTNISKSTVEQKLLNQLAFNLYTPDHIGRIPMLENDPVYSHRLSLTHKADEKSKLSLHFNSFGAVPQFAHSQPIYDREYDSRIAATCKLTYLNCAAISKRVADMWLQGIDDHITREANLLMQVTATGQSIKISHTQKSGAFISNHRLVYDQSGDDAHTLSEQLFFTKDLMPVLASLGHLPIDGDVTFKLGHHVLIVEFSTGVADYQIAVPSVDEKSKAVHIAAFQTYLPRIGHPTQAQVDENRIDALMGTHELNDYSADGAIQTHDDIETTYLEI